MAISAKQRKIGLAKKHAPTVPGETCPSIDYVQEVFDQIVVRTDDDWAKKQYRLALGVLEYIRDSNHELRQSSYYWYKKYKASA